MYLQGLYGIDLHIHTSRYSACAELLNAALLKSRVRLCGLHGAVITEHDTLWSPAEIAALDPELAEIRIYRGVEVSSDAGHFVVIGLDDLKGIQAGVPLADMIRKADHDQAAVILVHHHQQYANTPRPMDVMAMPRGIHAIEVASMLTRGGHGQEARRIAHLKGWMPVAGSDAHALEHVGAAFTVFPEIPADEKALAQAIRSGAGIPFPTH